MKITATLTAAAIAAGACLSTPALARIPNYAPPAVGGVNLILLTGAGLMNGGLVRRPAPGAGKSSGAVAVATAMSAAEHGRIERAMAVTGAAVFRPQIICDSNVNFGSTSGSSSGLTQTQAYARDLTVISGGYCPAGMAGGPR